MSAARPAPLACSICAVVITRFGDAEAYRDRGKGKPVRLRCVDKMRCHLRAAQNRRREIGLEPLEDEVGDGA